MNHALVESTLATLQPLVDAPEFSGVVRLDIAGTTVLESAHGLADRAHQIAMTPATSIACASGGKGFTAMAVMALVEQGVLTLDTTARSVLGADLPLIDDRVTVEHLLANRSGIGDYIDEKVHDDITQHIMKVPVHQLLTTDDFLRVLDGFPQVFPPDERFAYNNGGFVVLALIAERAASTPYHELVDRLVLRPAGLTGTAFLRTDELPGSAAIGYLFGTGLRSNLLHLPVRASGDGGIFTTAADMRSLWEAFVGGRMVSPETVALMTRSHSDETGSARRYGLGLWLHGSNDGLILAGFDAGASFWSAHRPSTQLTYSVLANTSEGAWPVAKAFAPLLNA